MKHRLLWTNAGLLLLLMLLAGSQGRTRAQQAAPATGPAIPQTIEFNRDIRPILSDRCYACHGPGTQMATLRFDREEEAKKALRADHFAIVPGDPGRSEMIRRVSLTEPAARMPQRGEPLSARDRPPHALDRAGREMAEALVLRTASASGDSAAEDRGLGTESD